MGIVPPPTHDSAVLPCFHGCLAFLHHHFPPRSPLSHPLNPSLRSQQRLLPWDCSTIPKLLLPAAAPSGGQRSCPGYVRLRQGLSDSNSIQTATDQLFHSQPLNISPLTQDNCPDVGTGPLLWFPHPLWAGPVLLTLLIFPQLLVLPSFAWLYIFFSAGQVLLSALSWCSACAFVSEGVFLMYPCREMCSISTHSSAILFSCVPLLILICSMTFPFHRHHL